MPNKRIAEAGKATRFQKGHAPLPGGGRPKTNILRDYARKIIETEDAKTKKVIAQECIEILVREAKKGSLGHFQQLLQLVESDTPSTGWPGENKLDSDAVAKLIAKLSRRTTP